MLMTLPSLVLAILLSASASFILCQEWLARRDKERGLRQTRQRLGASALTKASAGPLAFLASLPFGPQSRRHKKRLLEVSFERDLPALLEVVALGMQAGMGFDQAFALYAERFDTPLARCCRESLDVWQKGLKSREEGMRELAERIDTQSFRHFCSSALRALRFGAPMTQLLLDLAQEARKEYRAKRQELVAKAPVKMLLPTGALILPAMLLLVMGPIMLDLMRKMG
ncbi:MAG: type II secretion system F family protein [Coriobacteriales bacterium]|jgi:tight adherence protein C|nr:type II secretion system F family protein [Coriobacteriales bacterium]